MKELVFYDPKVNKFINMKNERKSILLQNILSDLVNLESAEPEIAKVEDFKYFKEINESLCNLQKSGSNQNLSQNSISSSNLNNFFLIKSLHQKIYKKNKFENLVVKIKNFSHIMLDYQCITSINYILSKLISDHTEKRTREFENFMTKFLSRDFEMINTKNSENLSFLNFLEEFETIKIAEINLSLNGISHEKSINLDHIYFFFLFFDFLFPNLLDIQIDFNSAKINQYFYLNKNPYKITEKQVIKVARKYDKILFANYIISSLISKSEKIQNMTLKILDSYIIELNDNIINNICISNGEFHFHNFIYMTNILNMNSLFHLNLEFNSLDSILFEKINILLIKNISLESLSINLFPEGMLTTNLRKILLNENYVKNQIKILHPECELIFDLLNLGNLYTEGNNYVINEDKILNLLFRSFNENLKMLTIIIENKIKKLKYLKIIINPFNVKEMVDYDEYNCAIGSFMYNILKIFETQRSNIDMIEFQLDAGGFFFDFSLIDDIERQHINSTKLEFENNNSSNINLNSILLNFELYNFFPLEIFLNEKLTNLSLGSLCLDNLKNFTNFLESKLKNLKENFLNSLTHIEIKLKICKNFTNEKEIEFITSIRDFIKVQKPLNLSTIDFKVKNIIKPEYMELILKDVKNKKDDHKVKNINIFSKAHSDKFVKHSRSYDPFIYYWHNFNSRMENYEKFEKFNYKYSISIFNIEKKDINKIYSILFAIKKSHFFEQSKFKLTCNEEHILFIKKIVSIFLLGRKVININLYEN